MAKAGGIRAGRAFVEMYLDKTRLVRGLKAAQASLARFGAAVRAVGLKMIAMGGAIVAPLALAVKHFASAGDELQKMSNRLGISVQTLSEMKYATERAGTSITDFQTGIMRMQRSLLDAKRGLATPTEALKRLGLSIDDLEGKSPEEQFMILADALKRVEDTSTRGALAMMLFGRGGAKMLPLINEGREGIEKLRKRARDLGLTFDNETADGAARLTDAMLDVTSTLKAAVFHIGSAMGGTLTDAAKRMAETVAVVVEWVKNNKGLIVSIAKIGGTLLAAGAAVVMIGAVFSGLAATIGGVLSVAGLVVAAIAKVGAVIGFLMSPIGLVVGALAGLSAWFLTSTQTGADALTWLGDHFKALRDRAADSWGGIADALASGDIGLAAKIAWLSIKSEWQRGVHAINGIWQGALTFFSKGWSAAIFGTAREMVSWQSGLERGWAETAGFLVDAWLVVVDKLKATMWEAVGFIRKAWEKLRGAVTGEDTTAKQEQIDKETASKVERIESGTDAAIGFSDRERRRKLADVEARRRGAIAALDDEERRRGAMRDAEHKRSLAGTNRDLANAQAEWEAAREKAKQQREDAEKGPGRVPGPAPGPADLAGVAAGIGGLQRKVESRGTFSAFAVRGMQAGGPVQRIAKASEKTATNTGSIDEQLAESRGVLFSN